MYRFLLRPRWLLSHLLVLALIVAMVNLSLWQLRRLDEKRELNALIDARADGEPRDLAAELSTVASTSDGDDVEFLAVQGSGRYLTDEEFTIPSRTLNGAPGRFVVTPLQLEAGGQLLVLRGFIPQAISDTDPPIDSIEPPEGEVTVSGWLRESERPGSLQRADADLGENQFARIDIDGIEESTGRDYQPVYLQLAAQEPATESPYLSPLPLPDRTEGPHFSYAMQWAIFVLIAIGGYPMILRRFARSQGTDDAAPAADLAEGDADPELPDSRERVEP